MSWLRKLHRLLGGHTYVSERSVPYELQVRESYLFIIYMDSRFADISPPLKEFFRRKRISYRFKRDGSCYSTPLLAFRKPDHLKSYEDLVEAFERRYWVDGEVKGAVKDWLADKDVLHVWEQVRRSPSYGDLGSMNPYVEGDLRLLSDADAVEMALLFDVRHRETRYMTFPPSYYAVRLSA